MTTQNVETTDPAEKIESLLSELAATTDQSAKKKIRRALRALGHKGGLRVVTNAQPQSALTASQSAPKASPAPARIVRVVSENKTPTVAKKPTAPTAKK